MSTLEPERGTGTGTLVEPTPQVSHGDGDHERFAHYVQKDKIMASALDGTPVVALCGKVWVPGRDPKKYPVCPMCKEIYESMSGGGTRARTAARSSRPAPSDPSKTSRRPPECARAHSGAFACHEVVETCGHVHVLHNLLCVVQSETVIAYVATHVRRITP